MADLQTFARDLVPGLPFNRSRSGEYVVGTYRQRLTLASGRFAMLDDGLGFQLVPWSPSLEKQLGNSGVARDDGGVDWCFSRKRGSASNLSRTGPPSCQQLESSGARS